MFMTEFDEEAVLNRYREEALDEGHEEEKTQTFVANIRSLMNTMGWNVKQAMNALAVLEDDRSAYKAQQS